MKNQSSTTENVIGKGSKYYTLWSVVYDANGNILNKKWIKNITTNHDKAVKYSNEKGFRIDYSDVFRGEKLVRKFNKHFDKQMQDYVDYYVKGKYKNINFSECKDDAYKLWYYFNVTRNNVTLNSILNKHNDVPVSNKFSTFVASRLRN